MKSPGIHTRLTALVCAALLLTTYAPSVSAQRRRAAARPRPRPASRAATQTRTQTQTPAQTRPQAQTQTRTQTQTPDRLTQPPDAATPARAQQGRRAEPDLAVEELLAADSYTVYMEIRRVGALAQTEEVKTAVASLTLFGGPELRPLTDLYRFVAENAEALAESRVVMTFLPARAGLPQAITAVGLASPEVAAAFEPKFRRLLGEQVREVRKAVVPAGPSRVPPDARRDADAQPEARQNAEGKADARRSPEAKPAGPDFALRRVGRWLVAAESRFTLKSLRGDAEAPRLADSQRFQSVRSRFADESLFVYVDTNVAQQGWALQMQSMAEAQPQPDVTLQSDVTLTTAETAGVQVAAPTPEEIPADAQGGTSPEQSGGDAETRAEIVAPAEEAGASLGGEPPPPPTEQESAVRGMSGVMRSLWGGIPRIPGAVALGAGLERGSLAVRLAVENTPDGIISLIPFLPNLVSGPPVTTRAAEVAPADAGLFFSGSLDWMQVYNSTLGAAALSPTLMGVALEDEDGGGGNKGEPPPPADEAIKAVEKLFGFKFKEELLPALGNEVAFSMPLDTGDFGLGRGRRAGGKAEGKEEEERDAEPGFVLIVSLNDAEKAREILPRVFVALGLVTPQAVWGQPEKRAGFEIRAAGSFAYTTVGDFLVAGEPKAVRHCVDSYDSRRTLAASNAYRDATDWQAKQKLAHIFVSDSIAKAIVEGTRELSGGSTDPAVVALLSQLDTAETAPASYEATNEGDVVVHEMRLPLSLIRTYAFAITVGVKDAPVLANESMAHYALERIQGAQASYREEKKKGRYGTLEELTAEGLLEKDFLENMEYRIEVTASSDKFEATATPKAYGKSGRRSFFVNETGKVRAADHKGEPAKADDPEVEL